MTAEELILSMGYGWKYETTESSARLVAEHVVETMYSEEEVLEMLRELEIECVINPRRTEIEEWFEQFKKK